MRKPRDFDAELKALEDKAQDLKTRKVQQLGELVIATGADVLSAEELAGALLVQAETTDAGKREAWAKRGRGMTHAKLAGRAPQENAASHRTRRPRHQGGHREPDLRRRRHHPWRDDLDRR